MVLRCVYYFRVEPVQAGSLVRPRLGGMISKVFAQKFRLGLLYLGSVGWFGRKKALKLTIYSSVLLALKLQQFLSKVNLLAGLPNPKSALRPTSSAAWNLNLADFVL